MPRKIRNPLVEDGLAAKIVNFCFTEPRIGYRLTLLIYGANNPNRIYKYLKQFQPRFLQEQERSYYTKSEPIVEELQTRLRKNSVELGAYEKKALILLLDSNKFRTWFGSAIEMEQLAKQGRNMVSVMAWHLARDATGLVVKRRLGHLPEVQEYSSHFHFFNSLKESLSSLEQNPQHLPFSEGANKDTNRVMARLKNITTDLFPEFELESFSAENTRKALDDQLNYSIILTSFPTDFLVKLAKLDHEGAKNGLWGATAGVRASI